MLFGAHLSYQTLWVWGATLFCLAVVVGLFRYTDYGRAKRASAINPVASRIYGIKIGLTSMGASSNAASAFPKAPPRPT